MLTGIIVQGLLAFVEGMATIISPCILPILPILFAGSASSHRRKRAGIILGITVGLACLLLSGHQLLSWLPVSATVLSQVASGLFALIGLMMLIGKNMGISSWLQSWEHFWSKLLNKQPEKFSLTGGILFGLLLSMLWTPCAGPILAVVLLQLQANPLSSSQWVQIIAFLLGTSGMLTLVAWVARQSMLSLATIMRFGPYIRPLMGLVMLIYSIMTFVFPQQTFTLINRLEGIGLQQTDGKRLLDGIQTPYPAPELRGLSTWINSEPINLTSLRGKVVLIDFWTYSCINCLRTLPYLNALEEHYHDKGLVIIGIHSPEFAFEHDADAVNKAVHELHILYPVALDNQFMTWQSFDNHYWPAHYLINQQGQVVYQHMGEGAYDVMDNNVRFLLGLGSSSSPPADQQVTTELQPPSLSLFQTPETYLGYGRAQHAGQTIYPDREVDYQDPANLPAINQWSLSGPWIQKENYLQSNGLHAEITLQWQGKKAYAVLGGDYFPYDVVVTEYNPSFVAMKKTILHINGAKLYTLSTNDQLTPHYLRLTFNQPGGNLYTFTFG